jgi:mono/diheme cytochrome c family protein
MMAHSGFVSSLVAGLAVAAALAAAPFAIAPVRAQTPAQTLGDPLRGRALARSWCANCHVVDRSESGRAADYAPPFPAIAYDRAMTPDRLRGWMTGGHTRMPNLNLSRRDIDDLIAYIQSLAKM